jgi:hypothetical protein
MNHDRTNLTGRAILAFVGGIFIGNVGWVLPSAVAWGGFGNIAACFCFPVIALALFLLAVYIDET